jgi:RNA polymerase sigma-70 factor (ECF subfamily)
MLPALTEDISTETLHDQTDDDLVAATKAGDTDAFGTLAARYQQRILHVAYKITRNREDAEDVAQMVFFKAFSRLKGFEGRSAFSTWLTRITVNESLMQIRRRKAVTFSLDEPADGDNNNERIDLADPGLTPEQLCSLNESRKLLASALLRLRPKLRSVVALYVEGHSGEETAKLLGLSTEAIKGLLFHARVSLRFHVDRMLRRTSQPRTSHKTY